MFVDQRSTNGDGRLFQRADRLLCLITEVIGVCLSRVRYRAYAVLVSTGIIGKYEPVPMYHT
jgi:hypothetical protein